MKKLLLVVGALCILGALFFGYFTLDRFGERDKAEERLASATAEAEEALQAAEGADGADPRRLEMLLSAAESRADDVARAGRDVEQFEGYAMTNLVLSLGLLVAGVTMLLLARRRSPVEATA